jgi:hypothetical protein
LSPALKLPHMLWSSAYPISSLLSLTLIVKM